MPNPLHADDPRAERVALWSGLVLAAASLGILGGLALAEPSTAGALVAQWLAHTALGKETSIPTGLGLGLPPIVVALASFAQDAVVLLVGYPFVLAVSRGVLKWPWLRRRIERPHPVHDAFAVRTESWGVAALSLTLWIPFLPSGGLVAALLARTAGYRPRVFLPVMFVSALAASLAYTLAYVRLAAAFGDRGLWVFVVLGALVSVLVVLATRRRDRRRPAKRPPPPGIP